MRDGEPLLQSIYKDTLWEGPIMRADKPASDNQVGIYGHGLLYAPAIGYDTQLLGTAYDRGGPRTTYYPIAGEIELWGTCIVHESGVRGERARIKRLLVYPRHMPFCRPETITQLANRYDCPVEVGVWYDPSETTEEKTS